MDCLLEKSSTRHLVLEKWALVTNQHTLSRAQFLSVSLSFLEVL